MARCKRCKIEIRSWLGDRCPHCKLTPWWSDTNLPCRQPEALSECNQAAIEATVRWAKEDKKNATDAARGRILARLVLPFIGDLCTVCKGGVEVDRIHELCRELGVTDVA